jgi:hypothetical protein
MMLLMHLIVARLFLDTESFWMHLLWEKKRLSDRKWAENQADGDSSF